MKNAILLYGNLKSFKDDPLYKHEESYLNFLLHIKKFLVDVNDCDVFMITSYMHDYEVGGGRFIFNEKTSDTVKKNIKKIFGDKLQYLCITDEDEDYKKEEEKMSQITKKELAVLFNRLKEENPTIQEFQKEWDEDAIAKSYMFPRNFFYNFKLFKLFETIRDKDYDKILSFRPDLNLQRILYFKDFDPKFVNGWNVINCFLTSKENIEKITEYIFHMGDYQAIYKTHPIYAFHSERNLTTFTDTLGIGRGCGFFAEYILYHGTRRYNPEFLLQMDKKIEEFFDLEITNENLDVFLSKDFLS